jgi:putative transposase
MRMVTSLATGRRYPLTMVCAVFRVPRSTVYAASAAAPDGPARRAKRGPKRFFGAVDHCVDDVVGWHTAKLGDRWAALEPLRQGVRRIFGRFAKDVARGLRIRCDWGPQYTANAWINEVKWLGMTITPSYVGEPECNGVAERFMRTLKEQCLYLHRFRTLDEARRIIAEFIDRYNAEWLIERLGHRSPATARAALLTAAA